MTIEKGEIWGEPAGELSPEAVVDSDAGLAALADEANRAGRQAVLSVTAGDLLATLGLDEPRPPADRHAYPIDLVRVRLDPPFGAEAEIDDPAADDLLPFVAHLTVQVADPIGRRIGHGPPIVTAAMNAAWHGQYRLGPRAHPNDGIVDVVVGRVPFGQRREAANRARSGSHLPHPSLKVARRAGWAGSFDRSSTVVLDGVVAAKIRSLALIVVPDAAVVLV